MKAEENPCYKCVPPKRKVGCHSTCKEHKDYLDKFHTEQNAIKEQHNKDRSFNTYTYHKVQRLKGWNHEQ
jgi:hypothetical protein